MAPLLSDVLIDDLATEELAGELERARRLRQATQRAEGGVANAEDVAKRV